jgi:hypothetical protein
LPAVVPGKLQHFQAEVGVRTGSRKGSRRTLFLPQPVAGLPGEQFRRAPRFLRDFPLMQGDKGEGNNMKRADIFLAPLLSVKRLIAIAVVVTFTVVSWWIWDTSLSTLERELLDHFRSYVKAFSGK